MKTICVALALMIVGCNKDPGPPAVGSTAPLTEVRLLGANANGPVLVRVARIDLTVDGNPLASQLSDKELDLGQDQQAWSAATFSLPPDAHRVAIDLQFQPLGTVVRDGKSQALDLSGPPLTVVADATLMRPRNKVVLQFDLSRSLVTQGDQVFLLPDFIVLY